MSAQPRTSYPGGKNAPGTWQRLISMMPPHRCYVEPFLGSGSVLWKKRAASRNVGIDVAAGLIAEHVAAVPAWDRTKKAPVEFIASDSLAWLRANPLTRQDLIFADPPYLMSARSSQREMWPDEFGSVKQHSELLEILTSTPAMVIITGYASPLYNEMLLDWWSQASPVMTHGGRAVEVAWRNFPSPSELHDYGHLGKNFHDRCRIKRKIQRLRAKLHALPPLERAAVIAGIDAASSQNGAKS